MRNHPNQAGRPFESSDTLERLQSALSALEQRVGAAPSRRMPPAADAKTDLAAIRARQNAVDAERRHADRLRQEVSTLRSDIDREMRTASGGFEALREEMRFMREPVERIATMHDEMRALRAPIQDAAGLRGEIERLKTQVASLAREDSLRELTERWTVLEREIAELPSTLASHKDLATVAVRLDDMNEAIGDLPRSLQLGTLEEHLRTLASAVEQMALHNTDAQPELTEEFGVRLDEISRAIAAIPTMPITGGADPDTLQRLEARIGALASQMDEMARGQMQVDYQDHFDELATRIDGLRMGVSPGTVSGEAMDALSERVDEIARGIELLSHQDPAGVDQARMVVADLEDRLADIDMQLQAGKAQTERSAAQIAQSLDERMAEIAQRIDENERAQADVPSIAQLDRRLEEIATLMADGVSVPGAAPDTSGLEAKIADLAASFAPERIAALDEQAVLTAARAAAEEVAQQAMAQGTAAPQALDALTGDLRALETLSRETDARNTQTFGAIHDTLLKVVDHLSGLEDKITAPAPLVAAASVAAHAPAPVAAAETVRVEDTPPLAAEIPAVEQPSTVDPMPASPAHEVAHAALGALEDGGQHSDDGAVAPANGKKTILQNVTERLNLGKGRDEASEHDTDNDDDGFDVVDDQPIEPGADQSALADIMQRVRMERAGVDPQASVAEPRVGGMADAGKSDFIAAARRAAQAAASDANALSSGASDGAGESKGALSSLLAKRRRPIIMGAGAILLAILALPLIRGLLDTGPQTAARDVSPPPIVETVPDAEPVVDAQPMIDTADSDIVVRDVTVEAQLPGQTLPSDQVPLPAEAQVQAEFQAPNAEELAAQDAAPAIPSVVEANDGVAPVAVADVPSAEAPAPAVADYDDIPDQIGPIALREAASSGDAKALYVIGDALAQGSGGEAAGLGEALKWYERSAELGFAPAQYRTGNFYEKGFGTERDFETAKTWYQLAAEQGNASAMHNLAVLFASGADGAPDFDSAARWFQRAAELGVHDSQFNLGILAARGQGVTQDLGESYKWFALAAQNGDADAASKRDDVANVLTADQLEVARGATALWKAKPVDEDVNTVNIPDAWQTDAQRTAAAPPLSPADMQKAVANIQAILNQNGYDAGPVDGIMGQKTRDAIIAFQRDNDMPATGNVDQVLVGKLLELGNSSS